MKEVYKNCNVLRKRSLCVERRRRHAGHRRHRHVVKSSRRRRWPSSVHRQMNKKTHQFVLLIIMFHHLYFLKFSRSLCASSQVFFLIRTRFLWDYFKHISILRKKLRFSSYDLRALSHYTRNFIQVIRWLRTKLISNSFVNSM